MTALAGLCGALVAGGLWLAVTSMRRVPVRPGPSRPPWLVGLAALDTARLAVAAAVGLLALVLTRWPVAAIGAGIGGWFAGGMLRRPGRERTEARTEAIALWTEMLRDSMGTARGVEGVLVATAGAAPIAIRPEVQRMAARLPHEPLADVLDDLAADLDHPLGDLVVTALRLTATTGGRRVRDVLSDLATAAYGEAESLRRIAVARQRPRAALKYTALVIAGFIAVLVVFSRTYLEPYGSPLGQLVLAVVGAYWTAGFWWMHRMGQIAPTRRFLRPREVTA
ncbi:MAG: type II secretion system F family protein [Ilumatobacteraceae bacterium]